MKWPWNREPEPDIPRNGFAVGDVVYHKVSGEKVVIIAFCWYEGVDNDLENVPGASVARSLAFDDEFDISLAEITKTAPAPPQEPA